MQLQFPMKKRVFYVIPLYIAFVGIEPTLASNLDEAPIDSFLHIALTYVHVLDIYS